MRRRPLALPLLALLGAASCSVSTVQGPQIRVVPEGFGFDPQARSSREVLAGREVLSRRGYFLRADDGNASIILSELEGTTTEEELRSAHAAVRERWALSDVVFGEVESHFVDGREAWGWFERQARSQRFVLVVPYDEVTWTVDFYTSVGRLKDDDLMIRSATSFGLDPRAEEREKAHAALGIAIVLAFMLVYYFRRQRQFKRRRRASV